MRVNMDNFGSYIGQSWVVQHSPKAMTGKCLSIKKDPQLFKFLLHRGKAVRMLYLAQFQKKMTRIAA